MYTFANQKTVKVNKPQKYKDNFLQVGNEEWQNAVKVLNASAFKLYLYLAGNRSGYTIALSPRAVENAIGLIKSSYHNAVNELIEKGFLVNSKGNGYDFYTTPISIPTIGTYQPLVQKKGKKSGSAKKKSDSTELDGMYQPLVQESTNHCTETYQPLVRDIPTVGTEIDKHILTDRSYTPLTGGYNSVQITKENSTLDIQQSHPGPLGEAQVSTEEEFLEVFGDGRDDEVAYFGDEDDDTVDIEEEAPVHDIYDLDERRYRIAEVRMGHYVSGDGRLGLRIRDLDDEEALDILDLLRKGVEYRTIEKKFGMREGTVTKDFEKNWKKFINYRER